MRDYDVENFEHAGLRVRILRDNDCDSPRENDNLGTMICWHRRYNLGDYTSRENPFNSPEEFREFVEDKANGVALCLPLFLYDHSGISMSVAQTGQYADTWDAGQVGYIYITRDKIKQEYSVKRITQKTLEKVRQCLVSEVEEYDRFIMGECYGYIIETVVDEDSDEQAEELDSCWGYVGHDWVMQNAKEQAEYYSKQRDKEHIAELEREATSAGDVPDVREVA